MGCFRLFGGSFCRHDSGTVSTPVVVRTEVVHKHLALQKLPNPDPYNFKILKILQVGKYVVVKINYPDCTNYEGDKISVYKATIEQLENMKRLDPHFCDKCLSPFARFEPTTKGWNAAVRLANIL